MGQKEVHDVMKILAGKWVTVQELEIILQINASTIRTSLKKLSRWGFIRCKNSKKEISYTTHDGRDMTVNKKVILWCCPTSQSSNKGNMASSSTSMISSSSSALV